MSPPNRFWRHIAPCHRSCRPRPCHVNFITKYRIIVTQLIPTHRHISTSPSRQQQDEKAPRQKITSKDGISVIRKIPYYSHKDKDESKSNNDHRAHERHSDAQAGKPKTDEMNTSVDGLHRAVVAFGSNLGDRLHHIEEGLARMKANGLRILRTSRLYETEAMYYTNQGRFLNGVVLLETDLEPLALLDLLQSIENELGRTREIAKGPRTLDLDIILYDKEVIRNERLVVPHPLLLDRKFVLQPLCNIMFLEPFPVEFVRQQNLTPTDGSYTVQDAMKRLTAKDSTPILYGAYLSPSIPFLQTDSVDEQVHIMSILNITPDSFSDGGQLDSLNLEAISTTVKSHIANGATILDIGGQSTRPNATLISPEEELSRVLPVLRHIKNNIPEAKGITISLDTFYSSVVRACAEENLFDIVNDVSAGRLDRKMFETVASLRKTIVLMHSRGTPKTMSKLTDYPNGLAEDITVELANRVHRARTAGIPPWRIILDPGIGFAKNQKQNLEILKIGSRHLFKSSDQLPRYPSLVGTSRKGFIGRITGVAEAHERTWGTAACVTAAVLGGADIVRVHDVKEMSEVVKMATAIRNVSRGKQSQGRKGGRTKASATAEAP